MVEIADSFQRKFDATSGRYYHVLKATGECIWDVPSGMTIPLEGPSEETRLNATVKEQRIAENKERARQGRLSLADTLKEASQKADQRELSIKEATEKARLDEIWRSACEQGKANGNVRVSWQKLGYISNKVYTFEQDYGRDLTHLTIVGNSLENWGEIPRFCPNAVQLSLASNCIKHLGEDVDKLARLTHLNLLRNQLEVLPPNIGKLNNLQSLELAGNRLMELPPSIANLKHLKRLNLECNKLQRLPETLGNMKCEVLNLNSNELTALPRGIGSMTTLRKLSVNDNRLTYLPTEIGDSTRLDTIHASKNRLMELPASIGCLSLLRCLWLDSNRLSALPMNFHQLKKLREFRMEGNPDMVLPTVDVLVRGAQGVLRWSECRFAANENSRRQNIVLSVQDVLKQVAQLSNSFRSLFEDNVEFRGDIYYQFVPEALWNVFLPACQESWSRDDCAIEGIRSFPYERQEVEKALAEFRDAAGRVTHNYRRANFRQCTCKFGSGKKTACVPQNIGGWACERPALLLRKSVTLERDMTEKRRRQVEQYRIDEAVRAAERLARVFLSTDEGKILVRQRAEARVLEAATRGNAESAIRGSETDSYDAMEISTSVTGGSKKKAAEMRVKLRMDYNKKLRDTEEIVENEFINQEVEDRRKLAEETNEKMKVILRNWMGLSMEDVFIEWKAVVRREKKQRRRDDRAQRKVERLQYESKNAQLEYAKREAKQWKKRWDEFNDVPYWINVHTDEATYDEPTVGRLLPNGWVQPRVPLHLLDEKTGEMRSMASVKRSEMDSPDSSDAESSDDESESDIYESREPTSGGMKLALSKDCAGAERETLLAANRLLQCRKELLLEKQQRRIFKKNAAAVTVETPPDADEGDDE